MHKDSASGCYTLVPSLLLLFCFLKKLIVLTLYLVPLYPGSCFHLIIYEPATENVPTILPTPKRASGTNLGCNYATQLLTVVTGKTEKGSRFRSEVTQWSPHGNPAILGVVTESRVRALMRYTMVVSIWAKNPAPARPDAVRHVDPQRDQVLFMATDNVAAAQL